VNFLQIINTLLSKHAKVDVIIDISLLCNAEIVGAIEWDTNSLQRMWSWRKWQVSKKEGRNVLWGKKITRLADIRPPETINMISIPL